METKERKKERKYIAPDVECIECELESAILGTSQSGGSENGDFEGDHL